MNERRDPDRLIHDFLAEGAVHLHDQVYDTVRAEIEQRRQRVVIGPWRMPTVNKLVPLGLGAAALIAVVFAGTQLLGPPRPGAVGGAPSAEPSASPAGTAPASGLAFGELAPGSHTLWERGVPMTVTIPGSGWFGQPGDGILTWNDRAGAPDGAGMIVFAGPEDLVVYGHPCDWSSSRPTTPHATVDEVVAALAAQPLRNASTPADISIDGHAGKSLTLHVPDDAVFGDCDRGEFRTLVEGADGARYHQDPGQHDKLWVVDVDGQVVVIDIGYYDTTDPAVVEQLESIVGSIRFE
ncbi:MAG TPA: hypothetical protein VFK54_02715 [Candidatus Limnocylindrales bacterium]|nr:hypothetical protein [Candidatus Limnocylindrales bacterium]